uniref:cGMP-dependent protein kinase n=1 Tax=Esox lucius TaxID=8010 RepID=A0A3P9A1Q3_ESOLU
MGNGSMKSKCFKEQGVDGTGNTMVLEGLKARIEHLEAECRGKDEELTSKDLRIKQLQEQLANQMRVEVELKEEIQKINLQLNNQIQTKIGAAESTPAPVIGLRVRDTVNKRRGAKAGVSAEPTSRTYDSSCLPKFSLEMARVPKDASVKKLLCEALCKNPYLRSLEGQQLRDMVECMYLKGYQQGDYIIRQGDTGNHLFVLAEGKLDVLQDKKYVTSIAVWTTVGELAMLYNCTRNASVRAVSKVKTWVLEREAFQNIMRMTAENRHQQYRHFLRSVSLLANLPEEKLSKIVDCLEVEYYDKGEYVIREGEQGSTFYIIAKGKIKVTQSTEKHKDPQTINFLQKGDYFGEKALISDDVRSANIIADEDGVECLVIDRETFDQTVGTFNELQEYLQGYVATLDKHDKKRQAKRSDSVRQHSPPFSPDQCQLKEENTGRISPPSLSVTLDSLEVIATLGVGGFGRVELVTAKNEDEEEPKTFAMKVMKKRHIVDNRQQEHIHSERRILTQADSSFIVKLYCTFKDNKYVYMLLEACLGGELWSLLRDRGSFDESTAKFCVGCVTEAFDYLHHNRVIYRDLKPENLMLDADGYIKLVDFGFAKKIQVGQRTWTFCGTPEYVAPEIILNRGHNFSVDFWSLGILVYELLTGSPPFSGSDPMMTYTFTLKGIEKMDFPKKVSRRPEDLIRKLCRRNPAERLGNLKNGITDIKKHRWFSGFNWEGLKERTLTSPLKRELSGPTDHRYFDSYPPDDDVPPDELSGWDIDF